MVRYWDKLKMKKVKTLFLSVVALISVALMCSSCLEVVVGPKSAKRVGHGPPPHAPAHGHRAKHPDGVEVVYDSGSGVYVVVGFPDHYYCNGHYYRFHDDNWQVSVRIDGVWEFVADRDLPPGLRKNKEYKHVSKAHPGRGYGVQEKW